MWQKFLFIHHCWMDYWLSFNIFIWTINQTFFFEVDNESNLSLHYQFLERIKFLSNKVIILGIFYFIFFIDISLLWHCNFFLDLGSLCSFLGMALERGRVRHQPVKKKTPLIPARLTQPPSLALSLSRFLEELWWISISVIFWCKNYW